MADVARAAGVSQQTVSRVANGLPNVNEQTRQRVQATMQELGFRPSYAGRSLRDGRYHSVGLCVNDVTKFGNLSMIDGIASAAREHNCAITLVEMSKTEEFSLAEATRRMAALPVDGIIIGMSRMAPDFETFDPLPGIGTVVVTMYAHPRVTTVDSDHYGCSLLLMDHLFELGHDQIRYIGGPLAIVLYELGGYAVDAVTRHGRQQLVGLVTARKEQTGRRQERKYGIFHNCNSRFISTRHTVR